MRHIAKRGAGLWGQTIRPSAGVSLVDFCSHRLVPLSHGERDLIEVWGLFQHDQDLDGVRDGSRLMAETFNPGW